MDKGEEGCPGPTRGALPTTAGIRLMAIYCTAAGRGGLTKQKRKFIGKAYKAFQTNVGRPNKLVQLESVTV